MVSLDNMSHGQNSFKEEYIGNIQTSHFRVARLYATSFWSRLICFRFGSQGSDYLVRFCKFGSETVRFSVPSSARRFCWIQDPLEFNLTGYAPRRDGGLGGV